MSEINYIAAFLIGLLGSTHCIGMCGGIVGALTMGLPEDVRQSPLKLMPYLLTWRTLWFVGPEGAGSNRNA